MDANKESKFIKIFLLVAGLMLCIAIIPMWPYGYYTFLRLVVCGVSVYAAITFQKHERLRKHFIPLILLAVLFNPIVPIFLERSLWFIIDLAAAIYLLFLSKKS